MRTANDQITVPTREELVAKAVALQPLLREHSATGDATRRTADEVIDGLTEAGFFRLLSPRRIGGFELDLRTAVEVTETLAEADGSAAWLVGLAASASWATAYLPERAQSEIIDADGNVRIAASGTHGKGKRVDGGLRISGHWSYASGSQYATWAVCAAAATDDSGAPAGVYWCLVPAAELQLEDTWRTTGMRGTASNTWVGVDVFVPDYRLLSAEAMSNGKPSTSGEGPLYDLPFPPITFIDLMSPILGIGKAALKYAIETAPTKAMHHTVFASQSESVAAQVQIAEAALLLETARMHVYSIADRLDTAAAEGRVVGYDERAMMRGQAGYAAQRVIDCLDILVNVHGAGAFAESNPLQRYWRNANTAARHATLYPVVGYEVYGKSLLGVDERVCVMV